MRPVEPMADFLTGAKASQHGAPDQSTAAMHPAMLFQLTMEHSPQYCPRQDSALRQALQERYQQRTQRATETRVQMQFFVSAEPSHVTYALLAGDSVENVRRWLMRYPIPQDVTVTPVQPMAGLLSQS